jgi:hypothetical protein
MNEIETMREGLNRAEKNLIRFRWIITNPRAALRALTRAVAGTAGEPGAETVVKAIDEERTRGS